MEVEILVHINARGRFKDDQRWRKIARQVTDFQPATVLGLPSDNDDTAIPTVCSPGDGQSSRTPCQGSVPATVKAEALQERACCKRQPDNKRSIVLSAGANLIEMPDQKRSKLSAAVNALPHTVFVPHSVCHATAVTTKWLQAIESVDWPKYPLPDCRATRRIKTWERGFWLIPLVVACNDSVQQLWQDKVTVAQGEQPNKTIGNAWTIEEVYSFWKRLSEQIITGNFGMVSLHRKGPSHTGLTGQICFDVRLCCWGGAALPCRLALRWASNGRIEDAAVSWVGVDGETAMSFVRDNLLTPDT